MFIETNYTNQQHTIVGEIYRIPNTPESISIERFDTILSKLDETSLNVVIGSDQNFDYLKIATHDKTADLFNRFMSCNMIPTITKPTRITATSATLIDNIYTRYDSSAIFSGIIPYNISDHFPVFCFTGRAKSKINDKTPLIFKHRPMDSTALAEINATLMNTNWSYLDTLDIDTAFTEFINYLNSLINKFAPEKEVFIPAKCVIQEEWMSKGLMKSSTTLTKLYRKCIKKPKTDPTHQRYIEYRNIYNRLKRTAKETYYTNRFEKYKNDIKSTWKLLNSLTGRNSDKSSRQHSFNNDGKLINKPDEITSEFCKYFTNIGSSLADSIKPSDKPYTQYLSNKRSLNVSSIFLSPTNPV